MPTSAETGRGLRERKRERTRQALLDAAAELFERHGYEGTTVAEIADTADIGTRTFFSYFASKEDLLFPDGARRIQTAIAAIDNRAGGDRPAELLLQALRQVGGTGDEPDDLTDRVAALRLRLIRTVPAVRGRALQLLLDAQRELTVRLHQAFPEELDEVGAATLVGAFIGAITAASQVLLNEPSALEHPDRLRSELQRAAELALRAWR